MATLNLAAIAAALPLEFDKKLSRQWNRQARLLSMLSVRPVGGKSVNFDTAFATKSAGAYTEGSDVDPSEFTNDTFVPAVLPWAHYRKGFALTNHAIEAAASSSMVAVELANLFQENIASSSADIASKLNRDLFTGTGSGGTLLGLDAALKADNNSYAGVSRGTYSEWKSNVEASASLANKDDMLEMEEAIFKASGNRPSVIVTTPRIVSKYSGLFDSNVRAVNSSVRDLVASPDANFFQGIPVIRDKDCPDGYMYMLDLEDIYIAAMPPVMSPSDAVIMMQHGLVDSNGDAFGAASSTPLRIESLAKTGDAVKMSLRTTLQLVVRRPNRHGLLANIS